MKTLRALLFLCSSAFICGCISPAWAQCPSRTTVAETLFNADGTLAEGRIVIAWQTFAIGACQVPAGQVTVNVTAGALSVQLYPNTSAVPAGTSYRVTYYLRSGRINTEYWVVPASGAPVGLAAIRSATVPVPNVMFGQAQVTNLSVDLAKKLELPSPCVAGKFLQANGSTAPPQVNCVDGTGGGGGGSGTVTSVGLALPAQFSVSGSPVTASGTLSAAWLNQNANLFLAGPASGGAGAPAFRAIVAADIPSLDASRIATGSFADARVDDTITLTNLTQIVTRNYSDLQNIPSTFVPAAHALVGSAHTASGLTAGHYLKALGATSFGFAQIAFGDISGNISASQQNSPAAGAKGGVEAKTCSGTDKLSAIGTDGIPLCTADQTGGGSSHEMLSATHTDTTAATVIRGALIVGRTATPKWESLAVGAANRVLASDGTDPAWTVLTSTHLPSSVVYDTAVVTRDYPLTCTHPRVKSLAGNAFFDVEGLTTGDFDQLVAKFNDAVDGRIVCSGFVPNELAATPAAKIIFDVQPHAACGSSQNFRVNVRYRFWGSGSADSALTAETAQDIAGSTTGHSLTRTTFPASGSLSSAPSAGNNVVVEAQRDGAHANDNCAQVMEIIPGSVKLRVDVKVKH